MKSSAACKRADFSAQISNRRAGFFAVRVPIDRIYGRYRNFPTSPCRSMPSSFPSGAMLQWNEGSGRMKAEQPTIANLSGLWRRSLLAWPDGRRDTETWVRWLQGPTFYADLRQPPSRPDFTAAKGLNDVDLPQIAWLGGQEGFAGELLFEDGFFEWRREVDFQLTTVYSDCGSLCFVDDVMIEEGRDNPYIEHWHHELDGGQPSSALRLEDTVNGCRGFIVRCGNVFIYARGRNIAAPAGMTLTDCIAAASSAVEARNLVDCEISYGTVTAKGWRIEHSSMPFKEGKMLDPCLPPGRTSSLVIADLDRDGAAFERRWSILDMQGHLHDFSTTAGSTVVFLREARS
jgi:hypothetical protein